MQPVAQLAAAGLAAMLFAAALGKLNSRARWALTTTSLFPTRLQLGRVLRVAIPAAELAVAFAILVRPALGLTLAAGLLLVFAVGVLGLTPERRGADCGCFGALMPSRVGPALAFRNTLLAAAAAAAAVAAMREGLPTFRAVEILLLLVIGIHVVVVAELWRLPRQTLRGASEMGTAT
jgi:hypothetical protein